MLPKRDLKLLYELDANYRKPYTQVGKKLRMSEQLVSYKVRSFAKAGIIAGQYPLIDYSRFGLLTFIVFFKVHYRSEQNFRKLIELLKEHENVMTVIECDGKYDLLVIFAAKNPSSFNKKLKHLLSRNSELRDWMILTSVVEHHYFRDYLAGKEGGEDTVVGGDREETTLDAFHKEILKALIDGKKKVIDIAAALECTPKTVISRLKWLQQQNILRGYRLLLNTNALGISTNLILVKSRHSTLEQEEELRHFCRYNPSIVKFTKTFGEWDALLQVETKDRSEFRTIFLQLRERFDDIIADTDTFRIFTVHKKQFLPAELW